MAATVATSPAKEAFASLWATAVGYMVPPPRPLGPFEITDTLLGEGGYGAVFLGRNTETGEAVAIKTLDGARVSGASVVREVHALRKASSPAHANVARLLGYYQLGGKFFLVTELATGGELFAQVEEHGAIDEARVRRYAAGLVAGVQHLHRAGVAHRDLKLENVLLDALGTPKIVDLGLAHAHARGTDGAWASAKLGVFCGSKSYCAPEVMARLPYCGFGADVWSLGVCLFAMASGFFPVDEASGRDWRFERIAHAQLQMPRTSTTRLIYGFYGRECPLSPPLIALLDAMLQINPRRRASLGDVGASPWRRGASAPAPAPAPAPKPKPPPPAELAWLPPSAAALLGTPAAGASSAAGSLESLGMRAAWSSPSFRTESLGSAGEVRAAPELEVSFDPVLHRSCIIGSFGSAAHGEPADADIPPAAPPALVRQCAASQVA